MIRQVLCDLDGTLIHFDHRLFVKNYIGLLSQKFAAHMDPAEFAKMMLAATGSIIQSTDGTRTNAQKFWAYFNAHTSLSHRKIMPVIDAFYENEFNLLKKLVTTSSMAAVLAELSKRKIPVALATNPVFPLAAVKARLAWGGFSTVQFNLITTYETSCYCKPNLAYYQEILDALSLRADECLMIGNDVSEDLAVGKLGVRTYLLTDAIINRYNSADIPADYTGDAAKLLRDLDAVLS